MVNFFFSCIQEKVYFFSTLFFYLFQYYLSLRNIGVAKQLAPLVKHVCTDMKTKVQDAEWYKEKPSAHVM